MKKEENICACGKEITRYSNRCKSCSNKNRKGTYKTNFSWMKGRKHSHESLQKISISQQGKKRSFIACRNKIFSLRLENG